MRITTTVQGQALPVALMEGGWDVGTPGRDAELTVDGVAEAGTVTTIHSTWTSAWRKAPVKREAIAIALNVDGFVLVPGQNKNVQSFQVQLRTRHHAWLNVGSIQAQEEFQPLTFWGAGFGTGIGLVKPKMVQWRVFMTAVFDDTSPHTLTETVTVT